MNTHSSRYSHRQRRPELPVGLLGEGRALTARTHVEKPIQHPRRNVQSARKAYKLLHKSPGAPLNTANVASKLMLAQDTLERPQTSPNHRHEPAFSFLERRVDFVSPAIRDIVSIDNPTDSDHPVNQPEKGITENAVPRETVICQNDLVHCSIIGQFKMLQVLRNSLEVTHALIDARGRQLLDRKESCLVEESASFTGASMMPLEYFRTKVMNQSLNVSVESAERSSRQQLRDMKSRDLQRIEDELREFIIDVPCTNEMKLKQSKFTVDFVEKVAVFTEYIRMLIRGLHEEYDSFPEAGLLVEKHAQILELCWKGMLLACEKTLTKYQAEAERVKTHLRGLEIEASSSNPVDSRSIASENLDSKQSAADSIATQIEVDVLKKSMARLHEEATRLRLENVSLKQRIQRIKDNEEDVTPSKTERETENLKLNDALPMIKGNHVAFASGHRSPNQSRLHMYGKNAGSHPAHRSPVLHDKDSDLIKYNQGEDHMLLQNQEAKRGGAGDVDIGMGESSIGIGARLSSRSSTIHPVSLDLALDRCPLTLVEATAAWTHAKVTSKLEVFGQYEQTDDNDLVWLREIMQRLFDAKCEKDSRGLIQMPDFAFQWFVEKFGTLKGAELALGRFCSILGLPQLDGPDKDNYDDRQGILPEKLLPRMMGLSCWRMSLPLAACTSYCRAWHHCRQEALSSAQMSTAIEQLEATITSDKYVSLIMDQTLDDSKSNSRGVEAMGFNLCESSMMSTTCPILLLSVAREIIEEECAILGWKDVTKHDAIARLNNASTFASSKAFAKSQDARRLILSVDILGQYNSDKLSRLKSSFARFDALHSGCLDIRLFLTCLRPYYRNFISSEDAHRIATQFRKIKPPSQSASRWKTNSSVQVNYRSFLRALTVMRLYVPVNVVLACTIAMYEHEQQLATARIMRMYVPSDFRQRVWSIEEFESIIMRMDERAGKNKDYVLKLFLEALDVSGHCFVTRPSFLAVAKINGLCMPELQSNPKDDV